MPLKYFTDLPEAVTIVGGLHGVLFIAFSVLVRETKNEHKKDWGWVAKSFIASVLPFGVFVMDHLQWKQEEASIGQTGF